MAHTYLVNRKGVYYFRMVLPASMRIRCGQYEWLYSLETKSYAEACRRCHALAQLAQTIIMKLNYIPDTTLSTERIKEIVRAYFVEARKRLQEHMHNVDSLFSEMDAVGRNTEEMRPLFEALRKGDLFYLPDSMQQMQRPIVLQSSGSTRQFIERGHPSSL